MEIGLVHMISWASLWLYSGWRLCKSVLTNRMAGFMSFKNLMRGKEVAADVWQAIINVGGKLILMLLLTEIQ